MLNIEKYQNFDYLGKQKKKKQIILCHTSRKLEDYLSSLQNRKNGKYDKVPHFIVTRFGKVIQLLPDISYSNFFNDMNVNRNSLIVSLENLGWLEKRPLKNEYINWIGSIYSEQVFEKKWRDYFFWQPYTTSQVESTAKLCNKLINEFSIQKKCIGHNTKINGIDQFEGIVSRSNYKGYYTDLNPSFNFENFEKLLENE